MCPNKGDYSDEEKKKNSEITTLMNDLKKINWLMVGGAVIMQYLVDKQYNITKNPIQTELIFGLPLQIAIAYGIYKYDEKKPANKKVVDPTGETQKPDENSIPQY